MFNKSYRNYPKIFSNYFCSFQQDLKDVLVKMLIEVLKPDSSTLGAWAKTVDFWYKHIFVSLSGTDGR